MTRANASRAVFPEHTGMGSTRAEPVEIGLGRLSTQERSNQVSQFADHFSGHAEAYARRRPGYPDDLFHWLSAQCQRHELVWDVGSGNGQAAEALSSRFSHVVASDASLSQLRQARPPGNVWRLNERAEASALRDDCADLVTCAQAAHWFEPDAFHAEVRRVARSGALMALWCYGLAMVTPAVDECVRDFHDSVLGEDWPEERWHIENGYRDLPFPFQEIESPEFRMTAHWSLDEFCGYLETWSACQRYRDRCKRDPLPALRRRLARSWGSEKREVVWPLHMRVGHIH